MPSHNIESNQFPSSASSDFHKPLNNFNGAQVTALLNQNWKNAYSPSSKGSSADHPQVYKPKASGNAWGNKDSVNKSSPWGIKKGSKLATGVDLLTELKQQPKQPAATSNPSPTPVKKLVSTSSKKKH
ncbi:hypothetical protein DSO57_1037419 [Entomophthora muscae]|uniref:Uncharacterized protein n=1 Tax=Entomophthora muscae TaxID=34485 RepID=A0ACC2RPX7_9FUNG|nr:hypothetical protein DSO57_1037419 [Entomophthora muscae]